MKAALLFLFAFVLYIPVVSQSNDSYRLQRIGYLNSSARVNATPAGYRDTVKILALMVDFQNDIDTRTTGTGKFQLNTDQPNVIDPPPHNSAYFSNKILFVQNYFRKVSKGKLSIVATILGQTVTMPKAMAQYAPTEGSRNRELADLAAESWRLADSANPGFPFNQYDAFVVFHAGSGHDINLANILGYDPTPYDLPSLYLSLQAFKDAYQDQSYAGIPVSGGAFRITNTAVLPETESHPIASSARLDTIQVSINGLFAASIGSYLGLPDLFDTHSGRSAIGQFGLMDGASIFGYYGLFPPEPSAWEKVHLGWVVPMMVSSSVQNLPIPAVGLRSLGQDTIYKVPISDKEYFLIENRNRDPYGNGQTLKLVQQRGTVTKGFMKDTLGFNFQDVSAINGSLIDVDDFDWALIGSIDSTHLYDGGGILIWHIDETVIDANLASNSVNANPDRRGVDLEEADGSQDIGQSYEFLAPGSGSETGSPLDAWFLGNKSQVYQNVFGKTSFPNSNSNSEALSLITVNDFSPRAPRMTFSVQVGDDNIKPLTGFPKTLGTSSTTTAVQSYSNGFYVSRGDSIYCFRSDGKSGTSDSSGLLSAVGGKVPVAFLNSPAFFAGVRDSSAVLVKVVDTNADAVYDSAQVNFVNVGHRITSPAVVSGSDLLFGHADGGIVRVNPVTRQVTNVVAGLTNAVQTVLLPGYAVSSDRIQDASNRTYPFPSAFRGYAVGGSTRLFVIDTTQRLVTILKADLSQSGQMSLGRWSGSISRPVVVDLYRSGDDDLLLTVGNTLVAMSSSGILLDGFPLTISAEAGMSAPPIPGVLTSNGLIDILTLSSNGLMVAYDQQGKPVQGFPIDAGVSVSGAPAVFTVVETGSIPKTGISFFSDDGKLFGYRLNVDYRPLISGMVAPISAEILPASRVYNWPNPVYGSTTQIRYFSAQDASISIKIYDLAGNKITELSGNAIGGLDGEVTWDVTNIQSGVYLARVEASGPSVSQYRIIKIAVVK